MILFITKETPSSIRQLEQFKKINYQVTHTDSSVEAVKISREDENIKLILIDIDSIGGPYTFLGEISHHSYPPIIYTTLQREEEISRDDFSRYFSGYLPKNTDDLILRHTIETVLNFFETNKKSDEGIQFSAPG